LFQGDYIRYPALLELSNKYGLQTDVSDASLAQQLEDLREQIRREIRKELKIKGQSPCRSLITRTFNEWLGHSFICFYFLFLTEGAENFKKVATDKRSLADVTAMVKKANSKLQELQVGSYFFTFLNESVRLHTPLDRMQVTRATCGY
jgi:hypothetical protein